jgi:hypothetical protein
LGGGKEVSGAEVDIVVVLSRLRVRAKTRSGYVEVQSQKSVTSAIVVSAQSALAASAVPHEIEPESPAMGKKDEEAKAGQPDAHGADRDKTSYQPASRRSDTMMKACRLLYPTD